MSTRFAKDEYPLGRCLDSLKLFDLDTYHVLEVPSRQCK